MRKGVAAAGERDEKGMTGVGRERGRERRKTSIDHRQNLANLALGIKR